MLRVRRIVRMPALWTLAMMVLLQTIVLSELLPKAEASSANYFTTNPGFEAGNLSGWTLKTGVGSTNASVVSSSSIPSAPVHSGTRSLKFQLSSMMKDIYIYKSFTVSSSPAIKENETYKLSGYVYGAGLTSESAAKFKVEYYDSNGQPIGQITPPPFANDSFNNQWMNPEITFQLPDHTAKITVYFRVTGSAGTVYWDDLSLTLEANPPLIRVLPEMPLFYSDMTSGRIDLRFMLPQNDSSYSGKYADIRISDPSTGQPIWTHTVAASKDLELVFNPQLMTERQAPYNVEVKLRKNTSDMMGILTVPIYLYDRPTSLDSSGVLWVNGHPFFPIIGYHYQGDTNLASALVNTVQLSNSSNTTTLGNELDLLHNMGLKAFVPLSNHLEMATIVNKVNALKNKPAVIGWMLVDEPGFEFPAEDLFSAYKAVRDLDPVHPVYITEGMSAQYRNTGRATDILTTDVYPLRETSSDINRVGAAVKAASEAVNGNKTIYTVVQTGESTISYIPTYVEVRHMVYQALLNGAKGIGYYTLRDSTDYNISTTALYGPMQDFKTELTQMGEAVTLGTKMAYGATSAVSWGLWHKDGDYYLLAQNVTQSAQTAVIDLPFEGYKAELQGNGDNTITNDSNQLSLPLTPLQSVFYKITPYVNLALNPGFENGSLTSPDGWGLRFHSAVTTSSSHSGGRSVVIPPYNDVNNAVSTLTANRVTVNPGSSYRLRAWVKTDSTVGGAFIGIREVKSDGSTLKYTYSPTSLQSGWTLYEMTVTPEAEAVSIQVYLKLHQNADASAYFDDVFLQEIIP